MLAESPTAQDDADQGHDHGRLPPGRDRRIHEAAGAGRFLGAVVRALQAAHPGHREGRRRRPAARSARQDEHRRAPADPGPARHPVDPGRDRLPARPAGRRLHGRAAREPGQGLHRAPRRPGRAERGRGPDRGGGGGRGSGRRAGAAELYAAVLAQEPENVGAIGGARQAALDLGDLEGAKRFLAMAPAGKENDPAIAGARAAIELAEQAASLGDVGDRCSGASRPTRTTIRRVSTWRWR